VTAQSPITLIGSLPSRDKEPTNARVLDAWIAAAQDAVKLDSGRLGWLVASTVVVAALQRAVGAPNRPTFLLKGGTYLQHRLGSSARPTKDVDGIISGDIDEFVHHLDAILAEPWGPLTLERGPVEIIDTPVRVVKPRRFDVRLSLRGKVWRRIQVEIAPAEGFATLEHDVIPAPPLDYFGLPSPDHLRVHRARPRRRGPWTHGPPMAVLGGGSYALETGLRRRGSGHRTLRPDDGGRSCRSQFLGCGDRSCQVVRQRRGSRSMDA
jgi:hypothetical protein